MRCAGLASGILEIDCDVPLGITPQRAGRVIRMICSKPLMKIAAAVWVALVCAGCAHKAANVYTFVPPGTVVLAGADLDRVRASPLRDLAAPFPEAQHVLAAWNGREVLAILRGQFQSAPSGTTLVDRGLALAGSPSMVQTAEAQHGLDISGNARLTDHAGTAPVWVVIQGGTVLPLPGNFANLNRLLRSADYAAIELTPGNTVNVVATIHSTSAQAASQTEESLRALVTLTAAADREYASLLRAIRVSRDDGTVRAQGSVPADLVLRLYSFSSQGK